MKWLEETGRRLVYLFRRKQMDREMAEEMRLHRELRAEEHVAQGLAIPAANAEAARQFGNAVKLSEASRDTWGWSWLESIAQDWRYGLRTLAARPGFTITALLSLVLGIGANTAVFSIMNAVMLRSLPVGDPKKLVLLRLDKNQTFTNPQWEEIQRQQQSFSGVLAFYNTHLDLADGGERHLANALFVSGDFFKVLGVPPILGRVFTTNDDRHGGGQFGPVVVISHRFWQNHFGSDPQIIGKTVRLDRHTFEIAGVTPAWFNGLDVDEKYDVAVPIGCQPLVNPDQNFLDRRTTWWLRIVGRLAPGTSLEQAQARLNLAAPEINRAAMPLKMDAENQEDYIKRLFDLQPAATGFSGTAELYRKALYTLIAVTGLVLLIACANIANLMLARAAARQREITIRLAIGAGRRRLVRQLLTESLLLGLLGVPGGLLFALWGAKLLLKLISSSQNPLEINVSPDLTVFAFASGIAIATGFLFGLAPAITATQASPNEVLKQGSKGGQGGSRFRLGQLLVAGQAGLSLLLLVCAGLFIKSMRNLDQVPTGFKSRHVLLVKVDTLAKVPKPARAQLYEEILEHIRNVPGIESAAGLMMTPISNARWDEIVVPSGYQGPASETQTFFNRVSAGYFQTMGIALIAGRDFDNRDTPASPQAIIINETAARQYFGTNSPIGKIITVPDPEQTYEIIGVVKDSKYWHVQEPNLRLAYLAISQDKEPWPAVTFATRTQGGTASSQRAIRTAITEMNRGVSLEFRDFEEQVNESLQQEHMIALLSSFFGGLALLLAIIGLYGVTSYAVAQRQGEIGIRMALGARQSAVVSLVLRDVLQILLIGTIIGLGASLVLGRLIAGLLFGIQATDPAILAIAASVLGIATLAAGYLPARRASRLNPMTALREQ